MFNNLKEEKNDLAINNDMHIHNNCLDSKGEVQ